MKHHLWGLVAAGLLLALPAQAFEFGFEGAKSATAAELEAETGIATKYPEWVQGRVQAGQRDWFWDHCNDYINAMGLAAFTNVNKCLGTHYRLNGERSLDRIKAGDVFWMVDLGSDPATVQAAFTAAAEAEAKAAADAAIAPFRDALLGNEEFRAEIAALVEGSTEGVNPWATPEELQGLRAEVFAELEKLGDGNVSEDSLRTVIGTLLDERGYITANVDAAVSKALEDSGLAGRLTEVENRVTEVEGSLANLATTVDEQGKAISNLPTREDVGAIAEAVVGNIVDARIAGVNAADRNWLVGLSVAVALAFGLMATGYWFRRPLWQRLSAVEGKAAEAQRTADEAKALAEQAFELSFNGLTLSGALPDFLALSLKEITNVSLTDSEGARAIVAFERVERVSADDKRPGLKVTGVAGQTNPLPLDSGINRRVLSMLAKAAREERLDFSRLGNVVAKMQNGEPAATKPAARDDGKPAIFTHRQDAPTAA